MSYENFLNMKLLRICLFFAFIVSACVCAYTSYAQQASQQERYIDGEHGFSINPPKGWFRHLIQSASPDAPQTGVSYSKNPDERELPIIGITMDPIPDNLAKNGVLDFSNLTLALYRELASQSKGEVVTIEQPHEIDVNGLKGSRVIFDVKGPNGAARILDCKFTKKDKLISIQGVDTPEDFDNNLREFEGVVNSFKF